jgi:hypothetical protein
MPTSSSLAQPKPRDMDVTDFETGLDTLQFSTADYGLPAGVLDAGHLVFGTSGGRPSLRVRL